MNVLYLLNFAGHGGTEKYVQLLVNHLKDRRIKPHLMYNISGKLSEDFQGMGITTQQLTMKHPLDIRAAYQLAKWCKAHNIHVIHTQFLRENYIAVLSKCFNKNIKVIYTNHVMLENNLVLRTLNRFITKRDHKIIAVCDLGRRMMIDNKVNKDRIEVIYNGVEMRYDQDDKKSTIRQELGIDDETFVISCLSRFDVFKGNKFLMESIKALKDKAIGMKYVFVLANEGPLWEEMKILAKSLEIDDVIHFIGFRQDVMNILKGSDLYVNPSEWEALSFAVIEALSASLPVVSTDTGGTPEVINEDSDCGLLAPYENPDQFSDALLKVMSDKALYDRLKSHTDQVIRTQFDIEDMVQKTYNTYL